MKRVFRAVASVVLALIALGIGSFAWLRASLPDCVVADAALVLSEKTYRGKTYSVWLVTTGSHDKARAVYLYEEPVRLDACGRRNRAELAAQLIDADKERRAISKVVVRSLGSLDVVLGRDAEYGARIPVQWELGE